MTNKANISVVSHALSNQNGPSRPETEDTCRFLRVSGFMQLQMYEAIGRECHGRTIEIRATLDLEILTAAATIP